MLTEAHRAFLHDIRAAILVFQTSPVGIELFSFVNGFFCPNKFAWILATRVKTLYNNSIFYHLFKKYFYQNLCCRFYASAMSKCRAASHLAYKPTLEYNVSNIYCFT